MKAILLLTSLSICISSAYAQPGTLDNSFGAGGKISQQYNLPTLSLADAIFKNDLIYVTGSATYNGNEEGLVARYNSNGTPDNSFGTGGLVRLNFNNNDVDDFVNAFAVQVSNKVTVCMDHENKTRLVRLQANGTIDNTFGGAEGLILPVDDFSGNDIAVLGDGSVMVLGDVFGTPILVKASNAGKVDSTFGTNGVETISLSATGDLNFYSLAIQSNGRMVIGGNRRTPTGTDYHAIVARLLEDGTPDNSFSDDGWTQPALVADLVYDAVLVSIQSDNKIVLGTTVTNNSNLFFETNEGSALFRYQENGIADNNFGTQGKVTLSKSIGVLTTGYFTFQSDNKFLLAGLYKNAADYEFSTIRLNTNGSVDNTYDTDGIARRNIGNGFDYSYIALAQSDNKAVLIGGAVLNNGINLALTRLNVNGSADNSFNGTGIATRILGEGTAGAQNNAFEDVQAIANDKILVCGSYDNGFGSGGLIVRYNSNGSIDNAFGNNGFSGTSVSIGDEFSFLAPQSDGKIIAIGTTYDLIEGSALIVAKLNANGTPDNTFGVFGKVMVKIGTNDFVECIAMAVQPDGKIVLSIVSTSTETFEDSYSLVKLTATGALDVSFDGDGKLPTDFPYSGLATQADNKLIAIGYPLVAQFLEVTRLNTNGTADNSFNSGVPVNVDFNDVTDYAIAVHIINNDKIVVSGIASDGTGGNIGIARLNNNGTPDLTFSGDGKAFVNLPQNAESMQVAADGSFIFSGGNNFGSGFAVSKVNADGVLNNAFGTAGTATFSMGELSEDKPLGLDLQDDGKILLSGTSMAQFEMAFKGVIARLNIVGNAANTYTFTGNGNWDVPANWGGGVVPPNPIPAGIEVVIDHANGGQCILNIPITVQTGGKITVPAGKTFRAAANIILPAISN
jgi:uncharacterized delta-60 repeat protein